MLCCEQEPLPVSFTTVHLTHLAIYDSQDKNYTYTHTRQQSHALPHFHLHILMCMCTHPYKTSHFSPSHALSPHKPHCAHRSLLMYVYLYTLQYNKFTILINTVAHRGWPWRGTVGEKQQNNHTHKHRFTCSRQPTHSTQLITPLAHTHSLSHISTYTQRHNHISVHTRTHAQTCAHRDTLTQKSTRTYTQVHTRNENNHSIHARTHSHTHTPKKV